MANINNRKAMRAKIEEETLTKIAEYVLKRKNYVSVENLFSHYETSGDGQMDIKEMNKMLEDLGMKVNAQL